MYKVSSKIQSFKDLQAWQHGHCLVLDVYRLTKSFPVQEQFGLTNQLRRAVVSITSNIAEGFNRQSAKEKMQFFSIALGSLAEVQNQLLIAKDIEMLNEKDFLKTANLAADVQKLIRGLIKYLRAHA